MYKSKEVTDLEFMKKASTWDRAHWSAIQQPLRKLLATTWDTVAWVYGGYRRYHTHRSPESFYWCVKEHLETRGKL